MDEKLQQIQNLPGIPSITSIATGAATNQLGEPQFALWGLGNNQLGGTSTLLGIPSLSSIPSVPMHHTFLNMSNFGMEPSSASANINTYNAYLSYKNNPQGIPTNEQQKRTSKSLLMKQRIGRGVSSDTIGSFDEIEQQEKRQRSEQLLQHLDDGFKVEEKIDDIAVEDFGRVFVRQEHRGGLVAEIFPEPSAPDNIWEVIPFPTEALCPALKRLFASMRESDVSCGLSGVDLISLGTKDKCRRILSLRSRLSTLATEEDEVLRAGTAMGLV